MKIHLDRNVVAMVIQGLRFASEQTPNPANDSAYAAIARELQCLLDRDPAPEFITARYAKGMLAVRCLGIDGFKSRAARLACNHLKARYSGRENAYIMSPAKAEKLRCLFAQDVDASTMTGELIWGS